MVSNYQDPAASDRQMSGIERIPFHGAKVAILVGQSILTIQRDDIPSIPWPGYWDLPGGAREGYETPRACVLRETREELGISLPSETLRWGACWRSTPSHIWLFVAECPEFDVNAVTFGEEGQRYALAPISWFLTSAKAIPSQKKRLGGYIARRDKFARSVLSA